MQSLSPDLSDDMFLFFAGDVAVFERVDGLVKAVWVRANTAGISKDPCAGGEVADGFGRAGLPDPVGECIAPTFTETTRLDRLQTPCGSTASQTV